MRDWLVELRRRLATEYGLTQWTLHLRPGSTLLPGQAVFRVFECREQTRGQPQVVERVATCGLAVALEIPDAEAFEAQLTALERAIALSRTVQEVLACHAARIPTERVLALDVLQRPGQDRAWYCQVLLTFEVAWI